MKKKTTKKEPFKRIRGFYAKVVEYKNLIKQIDAAHKQNGILLMSDLDEGLINKLIELADDKVIILFLKDGTRMEMKQIDKRFRTPTDRRF